MTLTVEIRKAGFENKGAAMMLIAATEAIQAHRPDARIAVAPDGGSPYESRARLSLWQRVELVRGGIDLGRGAGLLPAKLRHRFGIVSDTEINVVLDAAGLAYSDQWGSAPTEDLARRLATWKRAGRTVVLLPQAFGPFGDKRIREAIAKVADLADLIFARDPISLAHLEEAAGKREHVRLAPDFTNLLAPLPPREALHGSRPVAIVPNARMLDKTSPGVQEAYPTFLQRAINLTRAGALDPFFLIHEGRADHDLAQRVNAALDHPIPIRLAIDAQEAKGVLGACEAVISSRYHALISALSQAVPALGTGWSHKYAALFAEYGCPENLLAVPGAEGALEEAISRLSNATSRAATVDALAGPAAAIKKNVGAMWADVFSLIDLKYPRSTHR